MQEQLGATASSEGATSQLIIPDNSIELFNNFLVKTLKQMILEKVFGLQRDIFKACIFESCHGAWADCVQVVGYVPSIDKPCDDLLTYLRKLSNH